MAKIEMDISEYEAMKETKRVLEQSLERERDLQSQVKTLSDEKVKALEDAKMKVVKINRTETQQHILQRRPTDEIVRRLYGFFDGYNRGLIRSSDKMTGPIDNLIESFFERVTSISTPTMDEITVHGLDEIKSELRDDISSKMEQSVKDKIALADKNMDKFSQVCQEKEGLIEAVKNLEIEIEIVNSHLTKEKEAKERLEKELEKINDQTHIVDEVREIVKHGYGWFDKGSLLNRIIKAVNPKL